MIACGTSGTSASRIANPLPCSRSAGLNATGGIQPECGPAGQHDRIHCRYGVLRRQHVGVASARRAAQHADRRNRRPVEQDSGHAGAKSESSACPTMMPATSVSRLRRIIATDQPWRPTSSSHRDDGRRQHGGNPRLSATRCDPRRRSIPTRGGLCLARRITWAANRLPRTSASFTGPFLCVRKLMTPP